MNKNEVKPKSKDDGILGEGLAEAARRKLRDRQAQLDAILGETSTKKDEKKPDTPTSTKRERQLHEFQ